MRSGENKRKLRSDDAKSADGSRKCSRSSDRSIKERRQEQRHVSCLCCLSDFTLNANALCCKTGHVTCGVCISNCIDYQLKTKKIPLQCSMCSDPIPARYIDSHLNDAQRRTYDIDCLCRSLSRHEMMFPCQNATCTSASLVTVKKCALTQETHPTLMPCIGCLDLSCLVCLGTVNTTKKSFKRLMRYHSTECTPLVEIKMDFEKAVRDGACARCPGCGIGGRKESGCNSIFCDRCGCTWCYVCEHRSCSASYHALVQSIANNIERLHRYKTCRLLNAVYHKYGESLFSALWSACESVRAHGFSKKEIIEADAQMRPESI